MTAVITPPVQSPAAGAVRSGAVTAVVCVALAAVVAAMSSLNVALPGIARATHASQTQLAWIIDAYSLVFAALLLPAGAFGDRYGRRLALLAGLTIFGSGSAVAMTAHSATELVALVYSIIEAPGQGWLSARTLAGLAAGLAILTGFVLFERRRRAPLIDPRVFARRGLSAGSPSIFVQFFGFFGFIFIVLQYLQLIRGDSGLMSAVSMLPMAAAMMPTARLAPALVARLGARATCTGGLVLIAAALAGLAQLTATSSYWLLAAGLVPLGIGMGLAMTPATSGITAALPASQQGVGSAINDLSREVGGAVGIAVLASILTSAYQSTCTWVTCRPRWPSRQGPRSPSPPTSAGRSPPRPTRPSRTGCTSPCSSPPGSSPPPPSRSSRCCAARTGRPAAPRPEPGHRHLGRSQHPRLRPRRAEAEEDGARLRRRRPGRRAGLRHRLPDHPVGSAAAALHAARAAVAA